MDQYRLTLYRGDTYSREFRFWNDAGKTQPTDLTDITIRAALDGAGAGLAVACVVTLPNVVTLTIPAAAWRGIQVASVAACRWDMQFSYTDGTVLTPLAGPVRIAPDVTL